MIKEKPMVLREGFWHSKYYPLLPKPIANEKAWKGRREFLEALSAIEEKHGTKGRYKGWSDCRLCNQSNGTEDYVVTRFGVTWQWPEGLSHYIKEHNVRPSLAFQEWVLGRLVERS